MPRGGAGDLVDLAVEIVAAALRARMEELQGRPSPWAGSRAGRTPAREPDQGCDVLQQGTAYRVRLPQQRGHGAKQDQRAAARLMSDARPAESVTALEPGTPTVPAGRSAHLESTPPVRATRRDDPAGQNRTWVEPQATRKVARPAERPALSTNDPGFLPSPDPGVTWRGRAAGLDQRAPIPTRGGGLSRPSTPSSTDATKASSSSRCDGDAVIGGVQLWR